MRLFVGIKVEGEVAETLGRLLEKWETGPWPVKWVRPEGLHLTLKFLGSVQAEKSNVLRETLAGAVQGTPPLPFSLTELGAFPTLSRARILWAGLESEAALELLVHRIEQACATIGFPLEGRPYRPHVTLGRVREGRRLPTSFVEAFERETLPPSAFIAGDVTLYQSITGAGGARYEAQVTFPLGQTV